MNGSSPQGLDCAEVLDRLFAFVDGEMTEADWRRVQAHLDACGPCQANYRAECLIKALVARSCCEHAPAQLRERLLVEIRKVSQGGPARGFDFGPARGYGPRL